MLLQELIVPLILDTTKYEKGIDKASKDSTTFANKLKDFGSKAITAGIAGVTTAILAVGSAIATSITKTVEWANELDSLQDITGVTNEEATALNFVLHKSGIETETFTKGMVVLEKELITATGELDTIGQALLNYGINALDTNGKLKDQSQLINEVSQKYNSFNTQQERVNFLTEVFGRSGAELIDFFDVLANEGGLDQTTQKVKELGLVIDPEKYIEFQQNLEEVRLAGLGLAITFVDNLMPAFRDLNDWWRKDGLQTFQEMVKWIGENTPKAVNDVKEAFESASTTYETRILPVLKEMNELYQTYNAIAERLSPSTDKVASKFTLLGIVQREAVAIAVIMNGAMKAIERTLEAINKILMTGIALWDRYRGISSNNISVPTTSSSSGGRASGGPVIAGQSYNVAEFYQPEIFTPSKSGRIDKLDNQPKEVIARLDEERLIRILTSVLQQNLQEG